jgi:hypothetical protein
MTSSGRMGWTPEEAHARQEETSEIESGRRRTAARDREKAESVEALRQAPARSGLEDATGD